MTYQIETHVAKQLQDFFSKFDFIDKVVVFGSRARHDANPKSDIDLCIYSLEMTSKEFTKLKIELDELPILYKMDVVHFEKSNDALKENILRDEKLFFIKKVKFKDIFIFLKKSKIKASLGLDNGKYPFYTSSKILKKYLDEAIFNEKESLIFGTGGLASVHYIKGKFSTSTDCFIVKSDKKNIDVKYIYHYLFGNIEILEEGFHGAGLKHISKKYIENIDIPIPTLTKQKEIVKTLDKAQELIELRKESIKKLDELSKSIFIDMFGDPISNEKCWDIVKLSYYGNLARGKSSHRPRNEPSLYNGDYPFIQTGDVSNGNNIYLSTYKQTYSELGIKQSKLFKKGIIAIAIAANIGNAKILNIDYYFPDSVVGFETVYPEFTLYLLGFYNKILNERATKTAQKNINLKILNDLDVIKVSQEKQKIFSNKIKKIEQQKALYEEELTKLQENFDALLAQSFKA